MGIELRAEAIILIDRFCIKEITSRSSNPTQPKVLGLFNLKVLGLSKTPKMQTWGVHGSKMAFFLKSPELNNEVIPSRSEMLVLLVRS